MASKAVPFVDAATGIACTAYPNFKVKVGCGTVGVKLPKASQFVITMRIDEDRERAVSRHEEKIKGLLAAVAETGTSNDERISLTHYALHSCVG